MCGIVGVVSTKPILDNGWLASAVQSLHHRGPNDSGLWWSSNRLVGFGHARLSIIDLSHNAHQPMVGCGGLISLIFNGEIYNHQAVRSRLEKYGYKFTSNSDTEVVLKAYEHWGENFIDQLNGMFAIVIADIRSHKVIFYRDRSGEKPLFFYKDDAQLRFASEIKAILKDETIPRKISLRNLDAYLSRGYVLPQESMLEGFFKLRPGYVLKYSMLSGDIEERQYWYPPLFAENKALDDTQMLDELEVLLEDSIKRQLQADVPLGLLLSGGLDSSLIAGIAARHKNKITAFTVSFEGHLKFDELRHAKLIADYFNLNHVQIEGQKIHADIMFDIARHSDDPVIDSSIIPAYLLSKEVSKYCAVALGGDGGDELFGGYDHYTKLNRLQKYSNLLGSVPAKMISRFISKRTDEDFKARNWLLALENDLSNTIPNISQYFDKNLCEKLLPILREDKIKTEKSGIFYDSVYFGDIIQMATRNDFLNYLPEDILVKVDRSSMAHSMEVRSPFLDLNIINFAFSNIPSRLKCIDSKRKVLLGMLAKKVLPQEFNLERKQGFSIPINDWLKKGSFRELFWAVLTDCDSIFDKKTVLKILRNQDANHRNGERLFGLVNFELWRREFKISL